MRLFIGSDHAGVKLKDFIIKKLRELDFDIEDFGTFSSESVDYPDYAKPVAKNVVKSKSMGILICGSGTGMMIAANKVKGVRAAVIYDNYSAKMAREHNNANIACLRARNFAKDKAWNILKTFLKTNFDESLRNKRRIKKIKVLER